MVTDVSLLYVRVVMLGVLRRTVFWAEKHCSFVGAFAHQACGTVRLWSEMHTALGSVRVCALG